MDDVVVIGAGPGGSAAAYWLAGRGLRVRLLDRAEFPRPKTCGDGLTPRAVAALHEMGVLPQALRAGWPIAGVDITAPDGAATSAVIPAPEALPAPCLVVRRDTLDEAIRERAAEAGAVFEGGVEVTGLGREGGGVVVRGTRRVPRAAPAPADPAVFPARLAVVATGASQGLLRRIGLLPRAPSMMLAARTYVEGASGLSPHLQIRFDGVPLPGYGWVFPLSASSANVGVGYFQKRGRRAVPAARVPLPGPGETLLGADRSARPLCERFLAGLVRSGALAGARPTQAAQGYPLRVDFPDAPLHGDHMLLAGEAAGLVNPLTGEGIDYALESGRLAADHAARMLKDGDCSPSGGAAYARDLRGRYERLFTLCRVIRDVAARPALLNRLVRVASRRDDLKTALVHLVLGQREPAGPITPRAVLQKVLALARG